MARASLGAMKKKVLVLALSLSLVGSWIGQTSGILLGVDVFAEGDTNETTEGELLDENDEAVWEPPELYIKAVNPGYKIDGINNVGEMIEIARKENSDTPISLAGTAIGYTNSSGNYSILFEFPEHSWLTGESILLRLASSPGFELANTLYQKTLAMGAKLELVMNGEAVDEVCWTGKKGCYKAFSSTNPTTLVRDVSTGEFEHVLVYEPEYSEGNYYVEEEAEEGGKGEVRTAQCKGVQFSEILSYYEVLKTEQFIEFYNAGASAVTLDGCKVRYKNKNYVLNGMVEAEGYFVYYPVGFSLTKNPTNSNKLELVDVDETVVDVLEYPNGQRKGTAYAYLGVDAEGKEIWRVTYAPTPGAPNNYQEFKTCEEGKVINKVTGNCVKVTSVADKVCKEGYYLNILTGRCRKTESITEKTCKEGYYLNPETNRCRKIQDNTGADYSLEPENYEENSSFVALYAVLGVLGVGGIYLIYEFRHEIAKLWRRVFRRSH
ncbi:hypothetical protein IKF89_01515 [Candidatus Saccharibacteria bacterium]|nr:hypothetical protein [Candidatus Saccharibacteria bacterium]